MTKRCRVRLGTHSLTPHFFRHSVVLILPAILLRQLPILAGKRDTIVILWFKTSQEHDISLAFSISKRTQLPALRIAEQPILLTKSKINRPGYSIFAKSRQSNLVLVLFLVLEVKGL